MKKTNNAAVTGFMLCMCAILFGIATNGGLDAIVGLIHIPSMIVTFGGAFFAILITADSFSDYFDCLKSFGTAFKKNETNVDEITEKILFLSNTARKEGLLVLEEAANDISNDFLKKGINMIVDGSDPELVRDILENDMVHRDERNKRRIKFWQDLGSYAPAWGMIGTLLGLIDMMRSMGNAVDSVGAGMSLALLTTLYGSILANWVCIPIARKLEKSSEEEYIIMEVISEGVLSIQAGDNPRIIQEKIKAVIEMREEKIEEAA